MIEAKFRGKEISLPECPDELTPEQYDDYLPLALAYEWGRMDETKFRAMLMSVFLGLPAPLDAMKPEIQGEAWAIDVSDGFLLEERDGHRTVRLDATRNLMPECRGFHGPGDWLNGVKFGEFVECLTILEGMAEADEDAAAEGYRHIARVLYHIPEEEKVPELLSYHAAIFFGTVWGRIQAAPIEINGKQIDFRIIFKSSGEARADDKTGWTGIIFEVAAAGVFGTVKSVEISDMWEVLLYLYRAKFEYLEERKRERNTK